MGKPRLPKYKYIDIYVNKLRNDCKKYASDNGTTFTTVSLLSGISTTVLANAVNKELRDNKENARQGVGIMDEGAFNRVCEVFHLNPDDYILRPEVEKEEEKAEGNVVSFSKEELYRIVYAAVHDAVLTANRELGLDLSDNKKKDMDKTI
jgi:hypothetical protein